MLQDDFCQQIFEVLVEIFWKKSQNRFGRGQVPEGHQPSEVVQRLEQLWEKRAETRGYTLREQELCTLTYGQTHRHSHRVSYHKCGASAAGADTNLVHYTRLLVH